jgi:hypothetical protein
MCQFSTMGHFCLQSVNINPTLREMMLWTIHSLCTNTMSKGRCRFLISGCRISVQTSKVMAPTENLTKTLYKIWRGLKICRQHPLSRVSNIKTYLMQNLSSIRHRIANQHILGSPVVSLALRVAATKNLYNHGMLKTWMSLSQSIQESMLMLQEISCPSKAK